MKFIYKLKNHVFEVYIFEFKTSLISVRKEEIIAGAVLKLQV